MDEVQSQEGFENRLYSRREANKQYFENNIEEFNSEYGEDSTLVIAGEDLVGILDFEPPVENINEVIEYVEEKYGVEESYGIFMASPTLGPDILESQ